jgi:hypothetical protein
MDSRFVGWHVARNIATKELLLIQLAVAMWGVFWQGNKFWCNVTTWQW